MKLTRHTASFSIAAFGLLLGIALVPARAGEGGFQQPISTAPILYYACMSAGTRDEYDSAPFSTKNPGPDLASHTRHNSAMASAFDAWLTEKYGYRGVATCGTFATLAEAKNWLQGRKKHVEQLPAVFNNKHYATDWTYQSGGPVVVATPQATQPAAPGVPTVFWYCVVIQNGVEYDSAVFEAPNDASSRRASLSYAAYLSTTYKLVGGASCWSKPTRAAAQAALQAHPAGARAGITQRIATGWVYKPR